MSNSKNGDPIETQGQKPQQVKVVSIREIEKQLLDELDTKMNAAYETVHQLVSLYSKTGHADQAMIYVQQLLFLAKTPEKKAYYLFSLGQLMEKIEDFTSAIDYYTKARTFEPADQTLWYFIHNNLGFSFNTLTHYVDGERNCRIAIQINPNKPNAYKNLGIALEGQKIYPEAARNYILATKVFPLDTRAFLLLKDLLVKYPLLIQENPTLVADFVECRTAVPKLLGEINELLKLYYC
jgi:tetratricopeptide (TPR) repeat protein